MSNFELLCLGAIFILVISFLTLLFCFYSKDKYDNIRQNKESKINYKKKTIKILTNEQIEEIHKQGYITPEEKLKEIESFGLCAPGDAIGSATWRCHLFECDCHKCLCDYVASKDKWKPFEFKVVNHVSDEDIEFFLQKLE